MYVYTNEIMSLGGFIVEGLERMVKLAFMTGFPDQILIESASVSRY